jgi:hypothetical protein
MAVTLPIKHTSGATLGVNPYAADPAPSVAEPWVSRSFNLGTEVKTGEGATLRYVEAAAIITGEGSVVVISDDNMATMATTATATGLFGGRIGVALAALALGESGWVVIDGTCAVSAAAATAAFTRLSTTVSSGVASSAAPTGSRVLDGIVLTTATVAAGLAPAIVRNSAVGVTNP